MTAPSLEDEGCEVESEGGGEVSSTATLHTSHPAVAPNLLAAEIRIYLSESDSLFIYLCSAEFHIEI